jgi:hypothetical protein
MNEHGPSDKPNFGETPGINPAGEVPQLGPLRRQLPDTPHELLPTLPMSIVPPPDRRGDIASPRQAAAGPEQPDSETPAKAPQTTEIQSTSPTPPEAGPLAVSKAVERPDEQSSAMAANESPVPRGKVLHYNATEGTWVEGHHPQDLNQQPTHADAPPGSIIVGRGKFTSGSPLLSADSSTGQVIIMYNNVSKVGAVVHTNEQGEPGDTSQELTDSLLTAHPELKNRHVKVDIFGNISQLPASEQAVQDNSDLMADHEALKQYLDETPGLENNNAHPALPEGKVELSTRTGRITIYDPDGRTLHTIPGVKRPLIEPAEGQSPPTSPEEAGIDIPADKPEVQEGARAVERRPGSGIDPRYMAQEFFSGHAPRERQAGEAAAMEIITAYTSRVIEQDSIPGNPPIDRAAIFQEACNQTEAGLQGLMYLAERNDAVLAQITRSRGDKFVVQDVIAAQLDVTVDKLNRRINAQAPRAAEDEEVAIMNENLIRRRDEYIQLRGRLNVPPRSEPEDPAR